MMHSRHVTRLQLYLLTTLLVLHGIYELYHLEVNPEEFSIVHAKRIDASPIAFFNFFRQTHILEKIFPWYSRLKEADSRVFGVGKFYRAFWKLPGIGTLSRVHLTITAYSFPNLLTLDSSDQSIRQRLKIRLCRYGTSTEVNVTVYSRRSSALFQYTIGRVLSYIFKNELKSAVSVVTEIHNAIEKRRDFIFSK